MTKYKSNNKKKQQGKRQVRFSARPEILENQMCKRKETSKDFSRKYQHFPLSVLEKAENRIHVEG